MRSRLTILAMVAASAALVLALSRSTRMEAVAAPSAATTVADTTSTDMPTIEVLLPRDERAELYQAMLQLTDRVEELQARVTRLEVELYVERTERPAR